LNLVIDWGNTQLKCAIFKGDDLVHHKIISENFEEELLGIIQHYSISQCIVSSVVNHPVFINELLSNYKGILLSSDTTLPITNKYATPQTLGNDRLANAVALHKLYPNQYALSIDFGTCVKYDFVTSDGMYLGGAIAPGFIMRLKAMHHFTDKLPLVQPSPTIYFTGTNTEQSLLSGAYFGIVAEVTEIINRYKQRYPNLCVAATGGDLLYFENELKNSIFAQPFLTLIGLNEILNYNAK
jgi:type III pantothenate kinase